MKKLVALAFILVMAAGCSAKFTKGQEFTMEVGTVDMANNIVQLTQMNEFLCSNGEPQNAEICEAIKFDLELLCGHMQYDFLKKVASAQSDVDAIRNMCADSSEE